MPAVEDNDIRDCSTQRGAISESLRVDAPGSSHTSSHSGELRILSVYGQGKGPLAVDGHETLFAASELEALSSLSADHSVAKSLNCSVRLVRLEELTGHQGGRKGRPEDCNAFVDRSTQCGTTSKILAVVAPGSSHWSRHSEELVQTPDTISMKLEEDIGGGMPATEDCDAFGDRSAQCGATSEILGVVAPGSSHWSSRCEELVQTPDTISIKLEEDIGGGLPGTEDFDAFGHRSTQRGAASKILAVVAPGSSHMSSHSEELVQQTPDTISIKVEEDIGGGMPAVDCDAFGHRSTQRGATSESLGVDGPGSSHLSIYSEELKILSVYGKGEGPLAVDGHDTLFTASEVEALNSLYAYHSAAKSLERGERLVCREELSVQQTPDTISIKVEEDIGGGMPAVEDNGIRDCSTQRGATSESLRVDAPGSSHMSSHSGELRILSVYGQGEGPLAVDGHDTLFAASELEALSSLSADHSVAKSLTCSVRLVRLEELTGHQGGGKGRPGVFCGKCDASYSDPSTLRVHMLKHTLARVDCDAFGDRSTQRNATSESLGVDAPGSSHMSSHSEELKILCVYGKGEGPLAVDGHDTLSTASEVEALNSLSADHSVAKSLECGERLVCREELSVQQQTSDTISIKIEEDIGGGMPAVEDVNDIRDCSTQCGATLESLRVDAPCSSHMSSHSGELRILSVYGQWEGPLAVDVHNTLFAASEPEALSSLSADHSVAKSLNCSVRLVRLEELTGHQGGRKGRPGVLCGKVIPNKANMIVHMRTHNDEKPYKCDQCTKRFSDSYALKIHMRTHSGEKPY
ncbi:unnamed protein product, partial [Gadus morhua 'NCC']